MGKNLSSGEFLATLSSDTPDVSDTSFANMTSTLQVTATPTLNGTIIKCSGSGQEAGQISIHNSTVLTVVGS